VSQPPVPTVGILANPMSGRDVRRLAARASTTTLEIKRDQVTRAAVGAVAGGARRIAVVRDVFRIATSAVEHLGLDAEVLVLDGGAEVSARDSHEAARALREAGCQVLVVLGGDGTNRAVARAWRYPLVPLDRHEQRPPLSVEAMSGAAAGLVASGACLEDVARAQKRTRSRASRATWR
jgi:predicted polyphosphate/ATP-dependent NAD kinase